jgi:SAM-dependent methyltransferase
MRQQEDKHWWFRARRRIVGQVISSLNLPRPLHILDVGCGTGGNLELLSAFGKVTGVEADDAAIAMATSRGIAKIYKGNLPNNLPASKPVFGLVVMTDVLEHIDADRESLVAIKSLMTSGAYLVVTVPAFPFLGGQHDTQHHHKRRYIAATLRAAMEAGGFEIEHLTYFNTFLFPVIAAIRLLGKLLPQARDKDELDLPSPIVNQVLEGIFASERHIIQKIRLPFGVSLLAIARKR